MLDELLRSLTRVETPVPLASDQGFLSTTDSRSFVGFQFLYSSIVQVHDGQVAVVDLGMRNHQLKWCSEQRNLSVITPNTKSLLRSPTNDVCNHLNKPYWLSYSPFRLTIYLDPDTIVLNTLKIVLSMTEEAPFITGGDELVSSTWFAELVDEKIEASAFALAPSTAVLGFDIVRDAEFVNSWINVVERAVSHRNFQWHVKDVDVRSLLWLLTKCRKTELVMSNQAWNWPARYGSGTRCPISYMSPQELLWDVTKDFRSAHILHFINSDAMYESWGTDLLDMSPHA